MQWTVPGVTHSVPPVAVGGAQAWASAGQPTLAGRRKWPTLTTTRTGPTRPPLAPTRRHKGLQVPVMPLINLFGRRSIVKQIEF